MLDFALRKIPMTINEGFWWSDVRDVADAVASAVSRGEDGEVYFTPGRYAKLAQLARIISDFAGSNPPRLSVPLLGSRGRAAGGSRLCGGSPVVAPLHPGGAEFDAQLPGQRGRRGRQETTGLHRASAGGINRGHSSLVSAERRPGVSIGPVGFAVVVSIWTALALPALVSGLDRARLLRTGGWQAHWGPQTTGPVGVVSDGIAGSGHPAGNLPDCHPLDGRQRVGSRRPAGRSMGSALCSPHADMAVAGAAKGQSDAGGDLRGGIWIQHRERTAVRLVPDSSR